MYADGYDAQKLTLKLRGFMRQYHRPQYRAKAVCAQVERAFVRAIANVQQPDGRELFPEGTRMASKQGLMPG